MDETTAADLQGEAQRQPRHLPCTVMGSNNLK